MKNKPVVFFHPFGPRYFAVIGESLCVRFTETAEIGVFHDDLRAGIHQADIRSVPQLPGLVDLERILLKMYMVFIRPRNSIKPRMSLGTNRDYPFYRDIIRQNSI